MSAVLRWEDPPPNRVTERKHRRPGRAELRWIPVAEELRERPGKWGVVYEGGNGPASGIANTIRLGKAACWLPVGAFEATYRKDAESTKVFARYLGEGS